MEVTGGGMLTAAGKPAVPTAEPTMEPTPTSYYYYGDDLGHTYYSDQFFLSKPRLSGIR
jgi:hypothetical protein